mgnify:FL=1
MTIEERADAYVGHPEEIDEFTSETIKREAYIRGAKEQKVIDEEVRLKKSDSMTQSEYDREVAFADWYNKNGKGTPTYSDAIEWARKEVINKACELLKSVGVLTDDDSIMGFIKAMGGIIMKTCRTCKHRQRWMNDFSPKVTQVCELKKGRTRMGFRKIKVTDPACEKFESEE